MSAIETAIRYSKRIEGILERDFGATGRGLHEKLTSVQAQLPGDVIRSIRWVATIRNRAVHEEEFELPDLEDFVKICDQLVHRLESHRSSAHPPRDAGPSIENHGQAGQPQRHKTTARDFRIAATLILSGLAVLFLYNVFIAPVIFGE